MDSEDPVNIWMECPCVDSNFWWWDNCVTPQMFEKGWTLGKKKEDFY